MRKIWFYVLDKVVILVLVVGVLVALAGNYSDLSGLRFDGTLFPEISFGNGETVSNTTDGTLAFSNGTKLTGTSQMVLELDSIFARYKLLSDYGMSSSGVSLIGSDPSVYFGLFEDFVGGSVSIDTIGGTTWRVPTFVYIIDSTAYAPGASALLVDSSGGFIALSVGVKDNDSLIFRTNLESFLFDTIGGKESDVEFRISFPDTTQLEFKVGLAERTTDMTGISTSGIYFRKVDDTPTADKVIFMTNRAGSVDSVTAIADLAISTFYTFGFHSNGYGTITGKVNGVDLTPITKFTPRTANLCFFILVKAGAARAARVKVYLDYVKIVCKK